jgi:aryl-alcohol dehydrogenase-like predicted oxidoreductase
MTCCSGPAHEAGAIVYSPMASGLLTGAFTAGRAASLDSGDWRRGHPDFTEPPCPRTWPWPLR